VVNAMTWPLFPWEWPGTCGRLVGPQDWSGWVQKISPPTRIQSVHRPACSELLYWLHYPSSVGERTKNIQDSGCSVSNFTNRTSIFSVYVVC